MNIRKGFRVALIVVALSAVVLPARSAPIADAARLLTRGNWLERWAPGFVYAGQPDFAYGATLTGTFFVGGRGYCCALQIGYADPVLLTGPPNAHYDVASDLTYTDALPLIVPTGPGIGNNLHTNTVTGECWGAWPGRPTNRPTQFAFFTCVAQAGNGPFGERHLLINYGTPPGECHSSCSNSSGASGKYTGALASP